MWLCVYLFLGLLCSPVTIFLVFANEKEEHCMYNIMMKLKHFDKKLSNRHAQKVHLVKTHAQYTDYLSDLQKIKSNGKSMNNLSTRSWLSELFQGVENDYGMMKNSESFKKVNNLYELFQSKPDYHNVYLLQMNGPLQFSWVVEQLPYQRGFRIFQSADDAYTLNAWLATKQNSVTLFWWNKDLIYWQAYYNRMDKMLANTYGCSMSDLDCLPEQAQWLKPWLHFVKSYNRHEIEKNFEKSWSKYGGFQIISPSLFYDEYLATLTNLTNGINSLVGTNKQWTDELNSYWIELFGTPNQYVFPGAPFIAMTKQTRKENPAYIEAFVIKNLKYSEFTKNSILLEKSLNLTGSIQFCGSTSNVSKLTNVFCLFVLALYMLIT